MARSDSYASVPEYRARKGKTSSDDDLLLSPELVAVSRYLDRRLDQPFGFNVDAAVSTRLYRPNDEIAPIASTAGLIVKAASGAPIVWGSVTALTIDEDFELGPLNAVADGIPFTEIQILGWGSQPPSVWTPQTYMPTDYRVQVTAIHGWPSVPEAIKTATIELTSILRVESPFATNRISELDQVTEASPQARSILKGLYMVYSRYGGVAVG